MKKAKHLQRFWAFLLAFVLVSTTIASDGMSIVAAEGETTTEQTVSDPKTAEQEACCMEHVISENSFRHLKQSMDKKK